MQLSMLQDNRKKALGSSLVLEGNPGSYHIVAEGRTDRMGRSERLLASLLASNSAAKPMDVWQGHEMAVSDRRSGGILGIRRNTQPKLGRSDLQPTVHLEAPPPKTEVKKDRHDMTNPNPGRSFMRLRMLRQGRSPVVLEVIRPEPPQARHPQTSPSNLSIQAHTLSKPQKPEPTTTTATTSATLNPISSVSGEPETPNTFGKSPKQQETRPRRSTVYRRPQTGEPRDAPAAKLGRETHRVRRRKAQNEGFGGEEREGLGTKGDGGRGEGGEVRFGGRWAVRGKTGAGDRSEKGGWALDCQSGEHERSRESEEVEEMFAVAGSDVIGVAGRLEGELAHRRTEEAGASTPGLGARLTGRTRGSVVSGSKGIDLVALQNRFRDKEEASSDDVERVIEFIKLLRGGFLPHSSRCPRGSQMERGLPDPFNDPSWVCKRWRGSRTKQPRLGREIVEAPKKPDHIQTLKSEKPEPAKFYQSLQHHAPRVNQEAYPDERVILYKLMGKTFTKAASSRPKLMEIRDQPQIPCTFSTITQELCEVRTVLSRKLQEGSIYYSKDANDPDDLSPKLKHPIYENDHSQRQPLSTTRSCRISERRFVFRSHLDEVSPKDRIGRLSGSTAQTSQQIASDRLKTTKFVKPNSSFGKEHKKKLSQPFIGDSLNSGTSLNFEQESFSKPIRQTDLDWETQNLVAKYIKLDDQYYCSPYGSAQGTPATMSPNASPSKQKKNHLVGLMSPGSHRMGSGAESPKKEETSRPGRIHVTAGRVGFKQDYSNN